MKKAKVCKENHICVHSYRCIHGGSYITDKPVSLPDGTEKKPPCLGCGCRKPRFGGKKKVS